MERNDAQFTGDVTIRVYIPGQDENSAPAYEGVLLPQGARNTIQPHPDADPELPEYLSVAANLVFSPLIIPQRGTIRVRAYVGSERLRLGSLLVTKAPDATPTP